MGTDTASANAFRQELAAWLGANLTPEVVEAGRRGFDNADDLEVLRAWNRTLADAGWAAVAWPTEHGGRSASLGQQLAHLEEMARVEAPGPVNVIGVSNIAPAMMAFGTDEQKARYLRPMLRGDEIWCQGMSEPDAGSDLASMRTAAVPQDDRFVVNGHKTWNTLGRFADWCQLYARTDPAAPKHKGISCLLVDMHSPGIEVCPLRTMTGELSFSELFFDDVEVPRSALLGGLHEGWKVAMATLSHERAGVARLHMGLSATFSQLLTEIRRRGVVPCADKRDSLARIYGHIACMRWSTDRGLLGMGGGGQPSPAMGSLVKLMWARTTQELAEVAVNLLGPGALCGPWAANLLGSPSSSIAGGTGEINRNIVAEQGLGLPRS